MTEINYNEIAAEIVKSMAIASVKTAANAAGSTIDAARISLRSGYANYLEHIAHKLGQVKTLVHPDRPTSVHDLYVSPVFSIDRSLVTDLNLIGKLKTQKRILIRGTAGGGKSIFLKWLVLSQLNNHGRTPLFVELRTGNFQPEASLEELIVNSLKRHIPAMSLSIFRDQMKKGKWLVCLDGLDEVNYDIRPQRASEIFRLSEDFPSASIVVTSRPEEDISSISSFHVYTVEPFEKAQCLELIGRLDYDVERKSAFRKSVSDGLFERHIEFLSNPLLITMMLLTFSQVGEVPELLTSFYRQAFEVLCQRHDRSKGVYSRKLRTGLSVDSLERIFSYYSARTYFESAIGLGEAPALQYMREATSFEEISAEDRDLLGDFLEAVCVLQRDGLEIRYVHRSFQEYFCALFITRREPGAAGEALDALLSRGRSDKVLGMVRQLNVDLFEQSWLQERLSNAIALLGSVDIEHNPGPALAMLYPDVDFDATHEIIFGPTTGPVGHLVNALGSVYTVARKASIDAAGPYEQPKSGQFLEDMSKDTELKTLVMETIGEDGFRELLTQRRIVGVGLDYKAAEIPARLLIKLGIPQFVERELAFLVSILKEVTERRNLRASTIDRLFVKTISTSPGGRYLLSVD